MHRREFVRGVAGGAVAAGVGPGTALGAAQSGDESWRAAFPQLRQEVNGHPLVYLDTAATSLRPQPVLDALLGFYATDNANPGAALHTLARRSHAALEDARRAVARFIGSADPLEVVFTRGTTESLNLVASTWGQAHLRPGDEILLGIGEHASNLLPWRYLAERTGARVVYFGLDHTGYPSLDDFAARLGPRTRVVSFSHVSNVLGLVNPVERMCALARAPGRIVVVDGAQSVPHVPVDVSRLGCDFLAFSSHKMLGPMGVGVLWGRRELLDAMPPYQAGSNMAHDVTPDGEHLSEGALKYGAGTPNVSGPVGLAAAIAFLGGIGFQAIREHQAVITGRMLERLAALRGVRLLGGAEPAARVGVFSFVVDGRAPAELVRQMDASGIAIRGGDLAALPLLERYGVRAAARASCYLYTTLAEVDRFAEVLERAIRRT